MSAKALRDGVLGYSYSVPRRILRDFLFAPARARSPVKSLSGGERNRLLLARLFARPANALVLDEPTNDLDIETLELLEELLQDYSGTIFLVSHDRTFLDNVVTQTIAAEGNGVWKEYAGGYEDWLRCRRDVAAAEAKAASRKEVATQPAATPRQKANKLSWKEQRELETLPDKITALEAEQAELGERLADPELHARQVEEAKRIATRLDEIDTELLGLLERWEALEARANG